MSSTGTTRSGYTDLETIRDPDGCIAVISVRNHTGELAAGVFREYERDGRTEKTAFIPVRQIDSALRVLELAKQYMEKHQDRTRAAARGAR